MTRQGALEANEAHAGPGREIPARFMAGRTGPSTGGAVRRAGGWVRILNRETLAKQWRALEQAS